MTFPMVGVLDMDGSSPHFLRGADLLLFLGPLERCLIAEIIFCILTMLLMKVLKKLAKGK